jgi:thermitase
MSGTSMATPMVTGIAAMVRAYNPNYTYADTVAAIKDGGVAASALAGKTTSGNAANAMGALAYITTPTGMSIKIQ